MLESAFSFGHPGSLWKVFLLFTIPWGGGIPAGVTVGHAQGVGWMTMTWLYFISDVCLAFAFEPLMKIFLYFTKDNRFWNLFRMQMKLNITKIVSDYDTKLSPWKLILIAFGVDPMTGRAVALAIGHGFLAGWAIAIAGDMIFFLLIMSATLWLSSYIGDGTWAALVVTALIVLIPKLIRKIRSRFDRKS